MKLSKLAFLLLTAVLCLSFICSCDPVYGSVVLTDNSYFDRMIIKDGQVYMLCCLEFKNKSGGDQSIDVTAMSEEDAENGLLKDRSLELYFIEADSLSKVNEDNIDQLLYPAGRIEICGHDTIRYYACFVGEHGGGTSKHDRELPHITIAARPKQ